MDRRKEKNKNAQTQTKEKEKKEGNGGKGSVRRKKARSCVPWSCLEPVAWINPHPSILCPPPSSTLCCVWVSSCGLPPSSCLPSRAQHRTVCGGSPADQCFPWAPASLRAASAASLPPWVVLDSSRLQGAPFSTRIGGPGRSLPILTCGGATRNSKILPLVLQASPETQNSTWLLLKALE